MTKKAVNEAVPAAPKKRTQQEIQAEFMRPNPELDRTIIMGMLDDRETLMKKLCTDGVTEEMVLRRAADCGVSDAMLRQVRGVAADLAGERPTTRGAPVQLRPRHCLCCERVFLSTGAGNRLCMRCRGGDAGLAAL